MIKHRDKFNKSINNIKIALKALDAAENIINNVHIIINNEKKELNYTLEVIKEAQGGVGAAPRSYHKKIKPLSKEKEAEILASFFRK